ncbi:MAG TPA: hypothetical protein PLU50_05615, partial [Pseudobdellovibrionaceae bacterium]|nr:hypothetical protein [Pseudobdellovibrionaceae bacterium]
NGFSPVEIDALMRAGVVGQETNPKVLMQNLLPILEREPKVAGKLNITAHELATYKAFMSSTSSPEFDKEVLKFLAEHPEHRDKIWALLPEGTRKYITEHTKPSPVAAQASNGKTLDSHGKTEPQPKSNGNQSPGIANSDSPAPATRPRSAQLADDVVEFIQHNLNTGQQPLKSNGNRVFTNSKNQSMKESKIYTDIHRYKEEPEFWEVIDKHPDVAKELQRIRTEMKGYEDSLGKRSADKIIAFVDMHHSLPEFTGKREGTGVRENYLASLLYRLDNNPNFNKRIATHQRTAELVELGRKEVKGQRALEAAKEIVVMINTENPTAIQNLGTLQHIYYHNRRDPEFMKIINSDPASKKFFEEQSIKSVQSKSALDSSTETKSRKTFHETGILRSTRVGEDVVRFIEQNPDPVNPIPKQHGKRTYRNAQGDEKTEKQLSKEIGYFTEHNEFWDPIASHPQASKIMAEVKSGVTGKLGRNLGQDLIDFVKQENRLPSGSGNGEWNGISETSFRRKISLQQKNPYFLEKVNSHKRTKELMDKYFEDQKRLFPNSVVAHSNQTRAQTKASDLALGAPPYVTQSQELSNTQQLLPTTKHSDVQTPQAPKQTAQTSQAKAAEVAHQPPKAAEIAHQDPPQAALVPQTPKAPQPRVQATERQSGTSPT